MYWKFLRAGAVSPFTGFAWPTTDGAWVQAAGAADAAGAEFCQTGIHACRRADLPYWLTDELWSIELAEPVLHDVHKVVATRARLLGRVESWTPETGRELAQACVARTARHAADELREAGLSEEADRLANQPPDMLARRSGLPGSDLYAEEREWQAAWLTDRLGLPAGT